MNLFSIETGKFKLDGGAMFGVVPKSIWNKSNPADENNLCTWAMRCLLVEEGNRLILIDTGIGDKQGHDFFKHYHLHGDESLLGSINEAGFSPDEITDVFLTHLHFDHVGGATVYDSKKNKILPTFRNATYWSNQEHWDWATNPNPREKASFLEENLLPIKESGQLKFVTDDQPFPFMKVLFVDGHTEKQMLPVISFAGKNIIFLADLIPSSSHLKLPYVMSYDVRPLLTMKEKKDILHEIVQNDYYVFFEHDPEIGLARINRNNHRWEINPVGFNEI